MDERDEQRVMALTQARRYREAMKIVSAALASDPGDASALLLKAMLQVGEGELDGALRTLNAAIASEPDDPRAVAVKAEVLLQKGNPVDARRCVEVVVAQWPTLAILWALRTLAIGAALVQDKFGSSADRAELRESARQFLLLSGAEPHDQDVARTALGLLLGGAPADARKLVADGLAATPQSSALHAVDGMLKMSRLDPKAAVERLTAAARADSAIAPAAATAIVAGWAAAARLNLNNVTMSMCAVAFGLPAERVFGLTPLLRLALSGLFLVMTLFLLVRLARMARSARTHLAGQRGYRSTWVALVVTVLATAVATVATALPAAVALVVAVLAWFIGRRMVARMFNRSPALPEIRAMVRRWPSVVNGLYIWASEFTLVDLVAQLVPTIVTAGIAVVTSVWLFSSWVGMVVEFVELPPVLKEHWRHFSGPLIARRVSAQCLVVMAAAWAPLWLGWLGWVLLAVAVLPALTLYRSGELLFRFSEPADMWLHNGRIAYQVRVGGPRGFGRPESWG
jgi:tetratricopeptide (TPR) repeat protein